MSACSTDENDPTPDNGTFVIKPVKAPDHILYSGGKVIGTTLGSRGAYMNANMYGQDWNCSNANVELTAEDIENIKALLSVGHPIENEIILPWENYWVEQVFKGTDTYTPTDINGNPCNTTVTGSDHMDKLVARNYQYKQVWEEWNNWSGSWEYVEEYEHVNNFNNGNNTNHPGTDQACGKEHAGVTLMTNMSTEGITPNNQFGFHESYGTSHDYNNYLIVYYKGNYYVGFDYEMHKSEAQNPNEAKDVERDWNFTDWIVRISPAVPKGQEIPEIQDPNQSEPKPGDDDPTEPETPKNVVPDNHVEINLSINDKDNQGYFDGIVSKLSVHLRAATDVEIFIPVPAEFIIPQDDMNIFKAHNDELVYGGNPDVTIEGSEFVTEYSLNGHNIKLTIKHGKDGITITTNGMNQDILDECQTLYGDGLNFEIYNYFEFKDEESEFEWKNYWSVLKEYFDNATVRFTNEPEAYVNAFNKTEDGEMFERDCTVSIVDEQIGDYPYHWTGKHYNGSPYNEIYSKQE